MRDADAAKENQLTGIGKWHLLSVKSKS